MDKQDKKQEERAQNNYSLNKESVSIDNQEEEKTEEGDEQKPKKKKKKVKKNNYKNG